MTNQKKRINIYLGALALEELDRLAQAEGKSRGAVVEGLVLGAKDIESRLKSLEQAVGHVPDQVLEVDEHGQVRPVESAARHSRMGTVARSAEDPVVEKFEEAP